MDYIKQRKKRISNYFFILIGFFLILGSFIIIFSRNISNEFKEKKEKQSIDLFFKKEDKTTVTQDNTINTVNQNKEMIDYVAILEIPKIYLKKGLVDKNSKSNNVDKNIYTLKENTFPDEQASSHVLLASHSGNSHIAYFKHLKNLNLNDEIYLYYKNYKYIYKLSNIYEISKTGTMNFKSSNKSDITLITCVSGTNKQVVYIADLISKERY